MGLKKLTAVSGRHCKAIDLDGHTVGLLIVQLSAQDCRIVRLVIDPAFRRAGHRACRCGVVSATAKGRSEIPADAFAWANERANAICS
jgi:hypothetical protein